MDALERAHFIVGANSHGEQLNHWGQTFFLVVLRIHTSRDPKSHDFGY